MDSLKKWSWIVVVVVVVVLIASMSSFLTSRAERQQRIAQLTMELEELTEEKEATDRRAAEIDMENARLRTQVDTLQTEAAAHLETVSRLQDELEVARVNAFTTTEPGDYVEKIKDYYPEMAGSDWAVIQTTDPSSGLRRNYLKVPLGMADAFMFQQSRADNLEQQTAELTTVVELKNDIIGLQDRINVLTEEKSTAYMQAYNNAYAAYVAANKDFIDMLKQPNFKIDMPKRGALAACTALGLLLGAGI